MLWYLLERYVHVLLGRSHLSLPSEEQEKYERWKVKNEMDEIEKVKRLLLASIRFLGDCRLLLLEYSFFLILN